MMRILLTVLCFAGIVSQVQAADSDKESLILLPVSGVNLLVGDIMNRYNIKAGENKPAADEGDSFDNFKKRQMEEFAAFKNGGPTPQQIEERKRADAKALVERIALEEKRLQASFQWALHEGLQNRYQVFYGGVHPAAKLTATGNITKREYGYFLELAITDDSDKVVYSNSAVCKECNEIQVGVKFKDLGNVPLGLDVASVAKLTEAAVKTSMNNDRALWQKFQAGKAQDEMAADIAKQKVEAAAQK